MDLSDKSSLVQIETDDHGVAIVKINRPEKRNALSQRVINALVAALSELEKNERVKAVVLTGSRSAGPFSGTDFNFHASYN